jgi:hypothetical protein
MDRFGDAFVVRISRSAFTFTVFLLCIALSLEWLTLQIALSTFATTAEQSWSPQAGLALLVATAGAVLFGLWVLLVVRAWFLKFELDLNERHLLLPYWSKIDDSLEAFGSYVGGRYLVSLHELIKTLIRILFPIFARERQIPFSDIKSVLILSGEEVDRRGKEYLSLYTEGSAAHLKFDAYLGATGTSINHTIEGDLIAVQTSDGLIIRRTAGMFRRSEILRLGQLFTSAGLNVICPLCHYSSDN